MNTRLLDNLPESLRWSTTKQRDQNFGENVVRQEGSQLLLSYNVMNELNI